MKHLLRGFFIAVLFICCNFQLVLAQPMQTLPVDKNVRIGKLDTEQKTSRVMKPDWASCLGVRLKVSSSEQT